MKLTLKEKILFGIAFTLPFLWLAFLAGIVVVAVHFIAKYW